jgi:hypothetical protein
MNLPRNSQRTDAGDLLDRHLDAPLSRRLQRAARAIDASLDKQATTIRDSAITGRVITLSTDRQMVSGVLARPRSSRRALIVGLSAGAMAVAGVLAVPTGSVAAASGPGTITPPVTTGVRGGSADLSPRLSPLYRIDRAPAHRVDAPGPPPQTTSPRATSQQPPQ